MHFLKNLKTLVINERKINKDKDATNVLKFIVKNGSDNFNKIGLTEARDRESDARFKICFADNAASANEIKKHPNIYKYFPAVKEVNNLAFVIHSNLFELSSNRQNLTDTPINRNLLTLLSEQVKGEMDKCKFENRDLFKNLFTSILMSDESSNSSSGSGWQNDFFYNNLLSYIRTTIPTKNNGYSDNVENVKINKLKLNLDLSDFGLNHIQWFEWYNEDDQLLINEAKSKLEIKEWSIRNIVENADLEKIDAWIENCDEQSYSAFLQELEESRLCQATEERICQIKLFKFSDNKFHSLNKVIKKDIFGKPIFGYRNCFFSNNKTKGIKNELIKLGLVVSDLLVDDYPNIFSSVSIPDDKKHYDLIAKWCVENANKLLTEEKKKLFLNLINETTKFDNVGDETLKKLELFCDNSAEIKPLNKLVDFNFNTPHWLNAFKIKNDEYFAELKPFLISKIEALYKEVYLPNQDIILPGITEVTEVKSLIKLYQDNQEQFFKEFIIKKNEHSFSLEKKTRSTYQVQSADSKARKFISENCADNLFVLPYEFLDFKDEGHIIKNNDLYTNIIDCVEVDVLKNELIDIISPHYVSFQAKLKFLSNLIDVKLLTGKQYTTEDFEYKILNMATSVINNDQDLSEFRQKIVIESKGTKYSLLDIRPVKDIVEISNKKFSLSKIMPTTYQNSNLVSDLISIFTQPQLGIPDEKLNTLFGVNEELKIKDIFKNYTEHVQTLENPQQFFFLIYYNQHIEKIDLSKLGFDLNCAVYPSEFALAKEKLPEYLQNWVTNKEIELSELEKIGIWTENTVIVELRKFLNGEIEEFQNTRISQEKRFAENETALFNTFKWLKENQLELKTEEQYKTFNKCVDVINENRKNSKALIQDKNKYDFELLKEKSTKCDTVRNFTIFEYNGEMPKLVNLDEIDNYIFYRYPDGNYAVKNKYIYINKNENRTKILNKVALDEKNEFTSEDSKDIELLELRAKLEKYKKQDQSKEDNTNSTFLDDVNEFISELEGTEWSDFVPELKNILELSVYQPEEKQKLFNLVAKIKLAKELNINFEIANKDYNHLENRKEKYFVHSARGAFAYIHPNEILKMKNEGYKLALDFSTKSRIKIYETAEEILQLNTNHILAYQGEKPIEDLISFCEANRDKKKHLLVIDKDNASEKSRALLKLLNIEDDYQ